MQTITSVNRQLETCRGHHRLTDDFTSLYEGIGIPPAGMGELGALNCDSDRAPFVVVKDVALGDHGEMEADQPVPRIAQAFTGGLVYGQDVVVVAQNELYVMGIKIRGRLLGRIVLLHLKTAAVQPIYCPLPIGKQPGRRLGAVDHDDKVADHRGDPVVGKKGGGVDAPCPFGAGEVNAGLAVDLDVAFGADQEEERLSGL